MRIENNDTLRGLLEVGGRTDLCAHPHFEINDEEFWKSYAHVKEQHSAHDDVMATAHAMYRFLTLTRKTPPVGDPRGETTTIDNQDDAALPPKVDVSQALLEDYLKQVAVEMPWLTEDNIRREAEKRVIDHERRFHAAQATKPALTIEQLSTEALHATFVAQKWSEHLRSEKDSLSREQVDLLHGLNGKHEEAVRILGDLSGITCGTLSEHAGKLGELGRQSITVASLVQGHGDRLDAIDRKHDDSRKALEDLFLANQAGHNSTSARLDSLSGNQELLENGVAAIEAAAREGFEKHSNFMKEESEAAAQRHTVLLADSIAKHKALFSALSDLMDKSIKISDGIEGYAAKADGAAREFAGKSALVISAIEQLAIQHSRLARGITSDMVKSFDVFETALAQLKDKHAADRLLLDSAVGAEIEWRRTTTQKLVRWIVIAGIVNLAGLLVLLGVVIGHH